MARTDQYAKEFEGVVALGPMGRDLLDWARAARDLGIWR